MKPEDSPMTDGTGPVADDPAGRQERPEARSPLQVALGVAKPIIGSRTAKFAFVAAAVGIGGYEIWRRWADIHHALARIGPLAALGALVALLFMQFATLRIWQVLLAGLGSRLSTAVAGRIFFIGQLGKYLPGSVWPVLMQMELGSAYKVPRAKSASASVLTMLLSLLTGLITALVTLPFAAHSTGYLWVFLAAPVLIGCLHPRVLNPLLRLAFRLARRPVLDEPLTGRVLAHALAWSFAAWVFNGLQIWLLTVKLGAPLGQAVLLSLGGYAFAWCVGFLVIFASAGVGIRELLLVAALAPMLGTGAATAVALVSRVVTTVSDLMVAGAAAFGRPRASRRPAETIPAPVPVPSKDR
jgi:glycosyltransferase 2 family protein